MKIAFIGGGAIAQSIAVLAQAAGHDRVSGVRNPATSETSEFPRRLDRGGQKISLFVASDDADATQAVMAFGTQIGFAAVNAGPLKSARYLEAIAHLNLELGFGQKDGTNTAIIYHRESVTSL